MQIAIQLTREVTSNRMRVGAEGVPAFFTQGFRVLYQEDVCINHFVFKLNF